MNAWRRFISGWLAAACCAALISGCQTPEDKKIDGTWVQPKPARTDTASGRLPELKNLYIPEEGERHIAPETYLAAARLHESLGNNIEALEQYHRAISLKNDYTDALNGLANLYARTGRFQEADDTYRQAIKSAPDKAYLWNNRAFCYLMQQRWSEAEADLCYALEICPDFGRARINYAMVLAQQDRFDEAFTQFCMVLPKANAYYNLGLMYQSRRRPTEAAEAFRQALARNPELAAARKRLEQLPEKTSTSHLSDPQSMGSPLPMQVSGECTEDTIRPSVNMMDSGMDADECFEMHLPIPLSNGTGSIEFYVPQNATDYTFTSEYLVPFWPICRIQYGE
ncbi:MAG: tetratricopeptide repeat protein [Phycisphaerales bacterium]|nr:tetratricopeptide repeat protein [Phycisphaerales bacterium]